MKTIKLSILFSFLFLLSCQKDDPFQDFQELEKGAYARIIDGVNGTFDYFEIENSSIDFTVELNGDAQGRDIQTYLWQVSYRAANGTVVGPVDVWVKHDGQFSVDPITNLYTETISFQLLDIIQAVGVPVSSIEGGDRFTFNSTILLKNGTSFTLENTGTNLISSLPFGAFFRFTQIVECLPNLAGVFDYHTTAWCGWEGSGVISWELTPDLDYKVVHQSGWEDFSYGAYEGCYMDSSVKGNLRVLQSCDRIAPIGSTIWGDYFSFTAVRTNQDTLTIEWETSYEDESGITLLIRQDGKNWPDLKKW